MKKGSDFKQVKALLFLTYTVNRIVQKAPQLVELFLFPVISTYYNSHILEPILFLTINSLKIEVQINLVTSKSIKSLVNPSQGFS